LDAQRYKVYAIDPSQDLVKLVTLAPSLDVGLIMLHGAKGEDGCAQGLLELLDIPYQCASVTGCALSMNKIISKVMYRNAGLPIAKDVILSHSQESEAERLISARLPWPVVVKPASDGSSLGVSIVHDRRQLAAALRQAFSLDSSVLVEEFLKGTEITAAVLGNDDPWALPLIEIVPPPNSFFDFTAKYSGITEEICPARIPPQDGNRIRELAIRAHKALHLKGYSRSDFILTPNRGPVLLETNAIPGMSANSLLPLAARTAGLSLGQLLDQLIDLALERRRAEKKSHIAGKLAAASHKTPGKPLGP
jgi:D-alanine-D-alanine ligase